MENKEHKLCVNMDCERYPPDCDFDRKLSRWTMGKMYLCDGYYNNDGLGIFYSYKKSQIIKKQNVVCVEKIMI